MIQFPRWKTALIILTCLLGIVFALPNVLPERALNAMPDWLPKKQVVLGLDLQGGSHLLLEVDTKFVEQEQAAGLVDAVRGLLRRDKLRYRRVELVDKTTTVQLFDSSSNGRLIALVKASLPEAEVRTVQNEVHVSLTPEAVLERRRSAVEQSIEIVRRRIDETGTKEPIIQRQGDDRIILQLPGIENPQHVKDLLGQTAKLTFRMVDTDAMMSDPDHVPQDCDRLIEDHISQSDADSKDASGRHVVYFVKKQVLVGGESLVDAQATIDPQFNRPVVSFKFDSEGGRKFAEATQHNVGRLFAIVLDNKVISAPRINSPILGGQGQIEGGFTVKTANDLALLLRAGALPAPLKFLEERTVGPDLGADSIRAGQNATLISIVLVAVFMVAFYMLFGLVANVALAFNIILLFAALSALQATLTLPGIAGIALTIGMAVDANVLIYERIKEELRNGLKPLSAIEAGYTRAMATVTDSNLTTLLGVAVLYEFGTGPVRGFAVTLAIGILISMFTAISLTRLIVVYWYRWTRPKTLPL